VEDHWRPTAFSRPHIWIPHKDCRTRGKIDCNLNTCKNNRRKLN
jgi:hypothetical protein